jgi:glyoxylase-like metal-dependent hydrolase (beta-lactamase superfamily II)
MRIHAIQTGDVLVKSAFLNSPAAAGGFAPYLANLFLDRSRLRLPVCAWVIEHPEGVIVVDTGENAATRANFLTRSRFEVAAGDEIGSQLTRLGIRRGDITKVILTHLHGDHIDGLKDFEGVPICISQAEYAPTQASNARWIARIAGLRFPAWLKFTPIDFRPERFGPFECSFPLTSDGTVVAVPTPGHTAGHLSVIVKADGVHYFIAGDMAYSECSLMNQTLEGPSMAIPAHRQTLQRVRDYTRQYPTVYLPAHDPESAHRLAAKQIVQQNGLA